MPNIWEMRARRLLVLSLALSFWPSENIRDRAAENLRCEKILWEHSAVLDAGMLVEFDEIPCPKDTNSQSDMCYVFGFGWSLNMPTRARHILPISIVRMTRPLMIGQLARLEQTRGPDLLGRRPVRCVMVGPTSYL